MEVQIEGPAAEIKHLRRCINDLISVLALPAMWTGGEPVRILSTLLDSLLGMLHLDFIYVRLNDSARTTPIEMLRVASSLEQTPQPHEIGHMLHQLGDDAQKWPPAIPSPLGNGHTSILPLRLGLQGEIGLLVAGAQRASFPEKSERLVLSVAANQAAIGLQEARLLGEQKRLTSELDERVAQRTRELAAVNEELKKSERQAGLIVDGIPGLVARISPAGEVEVVNRPLLEYFGKDLEGIRNWANSDNIYPDDLPLAIETFNNSLPTGQPFDVEHRLRRFDGVYRWFQSRGLPLRDPGGRILHWYVLLTDIEERKQAEDSLRRSEAFLAEGQHLAKMGSFSWRVAKGEITWSEQLYRIFEFEAGMPVTLELIGSRVHPEDLPMMFDMVEKARRGVGNFEYEHRLLMPDHSVKYVHMIAHGFRDKDGLLEYVGAAQDITERRLSEQALGKLRSELAYVARITSLGVLTASIAHEVNQPLSGVITNAGTCLRMLSADPPNVEGALETARRTIRDGNRASDVIKRLRTLYSKKDISFEPMDLNEATREVISLSMSDLQRNRVILRQELAEDLPPIVGDRIQLQQVILNLLRNASDAMSTVEDRPRDLVIKTERDEGDRVRLSIRDAGVGIDASAADRLFEAFYTTKSDGMGMGLSVSRSIIEAHRGRLWATANDGPGATFSFLVPCRHADATTTQTAGAN